ncbi:probable ATP-dependent RNA helicase DDX52 [Uloborus diversus]|uniref:probable ATP-dependent RNA helicase DDX52 n=1 Tax=Uloborus diversus TaxID=327109 RepID=UPI00240962F6|nr:probable ATP-dependent RNA helicase DDX52 [Uloborus diversus]
MKTKREKKRLSAMHQFKIRQEEVRHLRRVHKIYVEGSDIPDPLEKFEQLTVDFNVMPCVLENIQKMGYTTPTAIQMQAIPLMLHNRQILACAPTGSGKTAAFLIPLIHNLKGPEKGGLRAVVIAPTRELAKQIHSFAVRLSEGTELRTLIIDDVNATKENPKIFKKHDILISTPNRLIYLLKNDPPLINLNRVQWLIVDECDKLFEVGKQGFRDQLAVIYNACDSAALKRAMFSATFSYEVEEWCKLTLDSLVSVSIGTRNTAVETIKQELVFVGCEGGKLLALRNLINEGFMPPMMVFVQSRERARELFSELVYDNIKVKVIHSEMKQAERDTVVQQFIDGKTWILICTELMGRGIDFKGVNIVINYDFPPTAISYIHRIGRTGRAGEEGRAITYFTSDDLPNLRSIAQVMKNAGCEVPDYIMKLKKAPKKNKGEIVRPIKREKISNVPSYQLQKEAKKRKMIQNSIKKKFKKKEKKSDIKETKLS